MKIRKTTRADLETVLRIYEDGRKYMRKNGNTEQWKDGYPHRDTVLDDIEKEVSFVVTDESDEIIAVFAFIEGPDITYAKIYDGQWPDEKPYFVIHRIAVSQHRKGVASFIYEECLKKHPVLRIDTHKDNIPMQNSLKKNRFSYCGIIHLLSGDERLAFQKER